MSYEFQIKRPMQTVELKINMMFDENLHLTKTMQRSVNHPLIEKKPYSSFKSKPILILKRFNIVTILKLFTIGCINTLIFFICLFFI